MVEEGRQPGYENAYGASYGRVPEDSENAELWQYIYVLRRRWWVVIICAALGVAAGWYTTRNNTPRYTAAVVVQRESEKSPLEGVLPTRQTNMISEMEIIRGSAVVGPAVDSVGLRAQVGSGSRGTFISEAQIDADAFPRAYTLTAQNNLVVLRRPESAAPIDSATAGGWVSAPGVRLRITDPSAFRKPVDVYISGRDQAVGQVQRGLTIAQVPGTNLIRVQYRDTDPEVAAATLNAIAGSYRDFSAQKARQEATRRREFIANQLAQVADSLSATQRILADYQTTAGTMDPKSEGGAVANALIAAETELRNYRFQEGILQSLIIGLKSAGRSDEAVRRVVTIGRDLVPTATELYGRLQQLETERSKLTVSRFGYTRNEPGVEVLDSLIGSTKDDIRAVTEQSLGALRTRLQATESRVAELQQQQGKIPARANAFSRLEQRTDAVQKTFDMLASKYYEAQIAEAMESGKVDIVDPAAPPRAADPLNTQRKLILALVLGIAVGIIVALLLEFLDTHVRNATDAERASGLKTIGAIPDLRRLSGGKGPLFMLTSENTAAAESFRMLRTTLHFLKAERPKIMAVTSAAPGEGKSMITANLAVSLARQGLKVLLIDGDLRRPTQHKLFAIDRHPGLTDVLVGDVAPGGAVRKTDVATLDIMTCGSESVNPSELLASKRFAQVLLSAKSVYDAVVIDTPPVLAVTDAAAIVPHVDGIMVVARADKTDRAALRQTAIQLRQVKAPMLGMILNCTRPAGTYGRGGGYYDYYGYRYSEYYMNGKNGKPKGLHRTLWAKVTSRSG